MIVVQHCFLQTCVIKQVTRFYTVVWCLVPSSWKDAAQTPPEGFWLCPLVANNRRNSAQRRSHVLAVCPWMRGKQSRITELTSTLDSIKPLQRPQKPLTLLRYSGICFACYNNRLFGTRTWSLFSCGRKRESDAGRCSAKKCGSEWKNGPAFASQKNWC